MANMADLEFYHSILENNFFLKTGNWGEGGHMHVLHTVPSF